MRLVLSEEERKARKRERDKKYYQEHKDHYRDYKKEYNKKYYQEHNYGEYHKEYNKTQKGRARFLVRDYKRNDKNANRGECTLTSDWIIKNIFTKQCVYCGESDWHELGCDRKDNSKPHTEDNVVPCCRHCNAKKGTMNYDQYMLLLTLLKSISEERDEKLQLLMN